MKKILFLLSLTLLISCGSDTKDISVDAEEVNLTPPVDETELSENPCLAFVYPITLKFPNNTEKKVFNDEDHLVVEDNWFENSDEAYELKFPLKMTIVTSNRETTVNSKSELDKLVEDKCGKTGRTPLGL